MPRKADNIFQQDHNYVCDALPRSIKSKITAHENAIADLTFLGAQPIEDHAAIREYAQVTRYNLERTILTLLERAKNG